MDVELIRISSAILDGEKVNHCGSLIFCDHQGESIDRTFTCNIADKKEVDLSNINLLLFDELVTWSRKDLNITNFFYYRQMNIAGWFSKVGMFCNSSVILRLASPKEVINVNFQTEVDDLVEYFKRNWPTAKQTKIVSKRDLEKFWKSQGKSVKHIKKIFRDLESNVDFMGNAGVSLYNSMTSNRDAYKLYLKYICANPVSRKEYKSLVRSVDDLPQFLNQELGVLDNYSIPRFLRTFLANRWCHQCGKLTYLKCSACMIFRYCSVGCQARDFLKHSKDCDHIHHLFTERQLVPTLLQGFAETITFTSVVSPKCFVRELMIKMFETFYRILPSLHEIKVIQKVHKEFQITSLEALIKRKKNLKDVAVLKRQMRKQFGSDNFVEVPS